MRKMTKPLKSDINFLREFMNHISEQSFSMISDYYNDSVKVDFVCGDCNNIWSAIPAHIKRGGGCPKCSTIRQGDIKFNRSKNALYDYIKDKPFVGISPYTGSGELMTFSCLKCDNEWEAQPNNIKLGGGCPKCACDRKAYETYKDKPTWLYYIFIPSKNLYKIGLAMDRYGGVEGRYRRESFIVETIQSELFQDGYQAYEKEQNIINNNKVWAWEPEDEYKFGGWTECFTKNIIQKRKIK